MLPFINEVLANLMRNIMGYFVKRSVLDETGTTGQLIRINMTENGNLMHLKNVKASAAAKEKKIFPKRTQNVFYWYREKFARNKSTTFIPCTVNICSYSYKNVTGKSWLELSSLIL